MGKEAWNRGLQKHLQAQGGKIQAGAGRENERSQLNLKHCPRCNAHFDHHIVPQGKGHRYLCGSTLWPLGAFSQTSDCMERVEQQKRDKEKGSE